MPSKAAVYVGCFRQSAFHYDREKPGLEKIVENIFPGAVAADIEMNPSKSTSYKTRPAWLSAIRREHGGA